MAVACVAIAQRNYVPATIITLKNDSLKGFVDFRDWYQAPTSITFKQSLSDASDQHFGPGDISGFRIGDAMDEYVSRKVKIDVTYEDFSAQSEMGAREIRDTLVFLHKLVTGHYNLYEYIDKHSRAHYIYDAAHVPVTELELIKAYVYGTNREGVFTDERYKQQLSELFADAPGISRKSLTANYSEKSLSRLFMAYNKEKNPATVATPLSEKGNVRYPVTFGLMGGMSFNSFNFYGSALFTKGKYPSYNSPIGGIWANVPLGRAGRNFSIAFEAFYKRIKTATKVEIGDDYKFDFSYLQVNTLVRYTYPTKSAIRPYANIGIGHGFMIKETDNARRYYYRPEEWIQAIEKLRKYEQSLVGGIGVDIYRFGIEARYNTSNGFSNYVSGKSAVNSFQLLARFTF